MARSARAKAKNNAWRAFSRYIRLRDSSGEEYARCCTCGKQYRAFGKGCLQAGHFIPSRAEAVLFDEEGVNAQCYNCNINLKGNWIEYEKFLIKKYGQDTVDRLKTQKYTTVKRTTEDYEKIEKKYKNLCVTLAQKLKNSNV